MQQEEATMQYLAQNAMSDNASGSLIWLTKREVQSLGYPRVASLADSLSRGLAASGIRAGQRVALFANNRWQTVLLALGIMQSGAVIAPLDPQMDGRTLGYVLQDAEPELVLADRRQEESISRALGKKAEGQRVLRSDVGLEADSIAGSWRELLKEDASAPESVGQDDVAALFYTSGTTGNPKGVLLSHANLAFQKRALQQEGLVSRGDRILLPLPLHHVYPFVAGMLMPLSMGLSIILPHSLKGNELLRASWAGQATVLVAVPRMYEALLSGIDSSIESRAAPFRMVARGLMSLSSFCRKRFGKRWGKYLLSSLHRQFGPRLQLLASGGAQLPQEVGHRLESLGWQVAIGYGLTETSPLLTLNPPGSGRFDSVGRPIPGVEMRIAPLEQGHEEDTDYDDAEKGAGEIQVKGPGVFLGYQNLPDKTRDAFTEDGWYRTGDIGRFVDGWLQIIGRISTMIVTGGGENVQPDTIEKVFDRHRLLKETGVLAYEGGLAVLAVPNVAAAQSEHLEPEEAARQGVREAATQLPTHHRPTAVEVSLQAIERTRLGKIRRHLLRERFQELSRAAESKDNSEESPEMSRQDRELLEHEAALQTWEILQKRLPRRSLHPDMELAVDLGLDSIAWVDLSMELAAHAGYEPEQEEIAELVTVRDLLQLSLQATKPSHGGRDPVREPFEYLDHEESVWTEPISWWRMQLFRVLHVLLGPLLRLTFRIETKGLERVLQADQPLVISPNHQSYLDIFVLIAVLPFSLLRHVHPAAWSGAAFANSFLSFFSRTTQAFPVSGLKRTGSSLAIASGILDQGRSLIWFPEGMRSHDGSLQEFQPGLGRILAARKEEVHIVPVCIRGTHEAMPRGSWRIRPAKVNILFGEPVSVDSLKTREKDAVTTVLQGLRERIREIKSKICCKIPLPVRRPSPSLSLVA